MLVFRLSSRRTSSDGLSMGRADAKSSKEGFHIRNARGNGRNRPVQVDVRSSVLALGDAKMTHRIPDGWGHGVATYERSHDGAGNPVVGQHRARDRVEDLILRGRLEVRIVEVIR